MKPARRTAWALPTAAAALLPIALLSGPARSDEETGELPRDLAAPSGSIVGGPARVVVFNGDWEGDPLDQPFARLPGGPFRLAEFPYPSLDHFASVFFLREGCLPEHRAVLARDAGAAAREGPQLGKVSLPSLPAGMGGVTGVLVDVTAPGEGDRWGVTRYRAGLVTFEPLSETGLTVTATVGSYRAFRALLWPGEYRVRVDGEGVVLPLLEVQAGEGAALVLTLSEAGDPSAAEDPAGE